MNIEYKPVIFIKGEYNYHRQNLFQQNLLLKALQITASPDKLKQMTGIRTVAEVYRTLDKMAIRKEYHEALAVHGLDLSTIVRGIKELTASPIDTIKLRAYQTLLKSIGLDEYKENINETTRGWEDVLREQMEKDKLLPASNDEKPIKYEVKVPVIPEEELRKREAENKTGKGLYEDFERRDSKEVA